MYPPYRDSTTVIGCKYKEANIIESFVFILLHVYVIHCVQSSCDYIFSPQLTDPLTGPILSSTTPICLWPHAPSRLVIM